jgi:hypothetical protein
MVGRISLAGTAPFPAISFRGAFGAFGISISRNRGCNNTDPETDFTRATMPAQDTTSGLEFAQETSNWVLQLASAKLAPPLFPRAPDRFLVDHILSCYRASDAIIEAMLKHCESHNIYG